MSDAALADDPQSRRVQRGTLSPEQEIEAARQSLERKDATIATQAATIESVSAHAAKAGAAGAQAAEARIQEREGSLSNAIKAAETSVAAAKAAKRSAREAGNNDAEMEADDALTDAKVELRVLVGQKADFDAQKPRLLEEAKALAKAPPVPADTSGRDRWFSDHPMFNTDATYKQDALNAHELTVAKKIPTGSPQYFDFLNTHLERLHGKGHGKPKENGGGQQQQQQQRQDGSSAAAPPGRDVTGSFDVSVDGSTLRLTRGADGKKQLTGTIPGAWREAASWVNMSEIDYAIQQVEIREEQAAGRGTVVQMGDGAIYR